MVRYLGPDGSELIEGPLPAGQARTVIAWDDAAQEHVEVYVVNGGSGGSTAANFRADTLTAMALAPLLRTTAPVTIGFAARPVATLLATAVAGHAIATSTSGTSRAATTPGIGVTPVLKNTPTAGVGAEVVQVKYDLTATRNGTGSNAAANGTSTDFGATTFAWPTPAAADGPANNAPSTLSSATGVGAAARIAQLNIPLGAVTGKDALTITAVTLSVAATGTTQALVAMSARIKVFRGSTLMASRAFDATSFTSPQNFDLTTAVAGAWANLPTLVEVEGQVAGDTTGLTLASIAVDAVTLTITATRTDQL